MTRLTECDWLVRPLEIVNNPRATASHLTETDKEGIA